MNENTPKETRPIRLKSSRKAEIDPGSSGELAPLPTLNEKVVSSDQEKTRPPSAQRKSGSSSGVTGEPSRTLQYAARRKSSKSAGAMPSVAPKKPIAPKAKTATGAVPRKRSGVGFLLGIIAIFSLFMGGGIGLAVAYVDHYLDQLPDIPFLEFYHPWMPSRIFAEGHHNMLIAEFVHEDQNREMATLAEMPDHLPNAVIALEDRRFFNHSGIGRAHV